MFLRELNCAKMFFLLINRPKKPRFLITQIFNIFTHLALTADNGVKITYKIITILYAPFREI